MKNKISTKKNSASRGKWVVVIQMPPQVTPPTTKEAAMKLKNQLSRSIPARSGKKLKLVKLWKKNTMYL